MLSVFKFRFAIFGFPHFSVKTILKKVTAITYRSAHSQISAAHSPAASIRNLGELRPNDLSHVITF